MHYPKLLVGLIAAVSLTTAVARAADSVEQQAQKSADQWLALLDKGNYAKTWDSAAGYFKTQVTKQSWQKSAKLAREPLGVLETRKLKSATFTRQLPGAPDGQYVVIQYDTKFKNKESAVETVTPMLDHEVWKVSGYFVK